MSKKVLWGFMFVVFVAVIGMMIYSDHYGNVEYQKALLETFKVVTGAIIGAGANEISK